MSDDWTYKDLEVWDDKIKDLAKNHGLDWYEIVYEICDYYSMIGHMSYSGLPSMYNHWSFGKTFERTHQMYNAGLTGLPYELIINSDPSIAYLMKENPLYLQILIMAHCVGHSDFFKNNSLFKNTHPQSILHKMKTYKKRIQSYVEDPSIGIDAVEEVLDAAHAIQWQCEWYDVPRVKHADKKKNLLKEIKNSDDDSWKDIDLNRIPLEPDHDLLGFIIEHGNHLDDWQKDILSIVRERSLYYIPQIRTKIINEGWASFWHFKILNELNLPQEFHIPFLKMHNQVVKPHGGSINPYHFGFHLFKEIEEKYGIKECFFMREAMHDESAIAHYVDEEFARKLNLFSYSERRRKDGGFFVIDHVSDEEGWKDVKNTLMKQVGLNNIPKISVDKIDQSGCLVLRHLHDGRDLELKYASNVVKQISTLWEDAVKLHTIIEDEPFEI